MGCGASTATVAPAPSSRHTRVVWDIENVPVPLGVDAFALVVALEAWLTSRRLWGKDVDGLVSCFCKPEAVTRAVQTGLDRAGVELVFAGQKREDADRKIFARLEREAAVLPRPGTSFVLISSDMDFAAPLRRLVQARARPRPLARARPPATTDAAPAQAGFADVVLLHAAPPGSSNAATLSHAATQAHPWSDGLAGLPIILLGPRQLLAHRCVQLRARLAR